MLGLVQEVILLLRIFKFYNVRESIYVEESKLVLY